MIRFAASTGILFIALGLSSTFAGPVDDIRKADLDWLWINPIDLEYRDLYYGLGGSTGYPATSESEFTFVEEDLDGNNPKYVVADKDGVRWKVKLGDEARTEVAASRLLWAVGYHTCEYYFVRSLRILDLPQKLRRGEELIGPGGSVMNASIRRYREHEAKVRSWKWKDSPFLDSREFMGLRIMMALLNNWDLKDINTAIYDNDKPTPDRPARMYMVSDLGSSFGSSKLTWKHSHLRDNLEQYARSKFIIEVTPLDVSFLKPGKFRWNGTWVQYLFRRPRNWITQDVPRADAKWIGQLLARLSQQQIRDAFRGAGFSEDEADGFTRVLGKRIVELNAL